MPLIRDLQGPRKRALLALLHELMAPLRRDLQAVVVIGSLGYNWDDDVFTTSDLDLMLVIDWSTFFTSVEHWFPAEGMGNLPWHSLAKFIGSGAVDMLSIKSQRKNIDFTLHVLDEDLFASLCRWEVRQVMAWRISPKNGQEVLRGFDGRWIICPMTNEPLPSGFCHATWTSIERDGHWFVGIPHGRLLHAPYVVEDTAGTCRRAIDGLWNNFLQRYSQETRNATNPSAASPLESLAKSHHFGSRARARLIRRIRDYFD